MADPEKLSASLLAQEDNIESFDAWSKAVGLRPNEQVYLPGAVKNIVQQSLTFPTWFRNDAGSPPYSSLDPRLHSFANTLRDHNDDHHISDNEINDSLGQALPTILRSCWRMTRYSISSILGKFNFKSIFDVVLLQTIWPLHSESILITMEPKLSLPKASGSGVRCTSVIPDSALCIDAGPRLLRKPIDIRRDFSSLANQIDIRSLLLPHLLIQYESPGTADPSALRQLKIAMVSALYQRRALRQPEHFVFGICQSGISTVDVVAARWVPVATEPPTGNQNLRDVGATGNYLHASTSKVKLEESRQSHEDLEIEFYYMDQLDLALPIDLVRLYLIVLATMPLAKAYRDQLIQNPSIGPAPGFCDWADDHSVECKSQTSETSSSGSTWTPKRKFRDIPHLPEMSSYNKCLGYIQSLPS